jgi:hypothetical protein
VARQGAAKRSFRVAGGHLGADCWGVRVGSMGQASCRLRYILFPTLVDSERSELEIPHIAVSVYRLPNLAVNSQWYQSAYGMGIVACDVWVERVFAYKKRNSHWANLIRKIFVYRVRIGASIELSFKTFYPESPFN